MRSLFSAIRLTVELDRTAGAVPNNYSDDQKLIHYSHSRPHSTLL